MRIAMVGSEKLPVPPIRGGAVQTYIHEVAALLAPRHELTIFGIGDKDLPLEEVQGNIRYVRIDSKPNDAEAYIEGLVQRLKGERFDVIEVFNRPMNVLPIHRASPQSRLVLSLHNEMFRETKIPYPLAVATLEVLDRIVTVSQYIADSVTARYPQAKEKMRTLYSGVSVEKYLLKGMPQAEAVAAKTRKELGLKNGPVILFVGRLSRNKGPDRLVAALPAILQRMPNANLLIVGGRWFGTNDPDDYVRDLWQQAEPVRDHIFFTGYVPHSQLKRYFAVADLFVCTSQWAEPLARVHYEAMASGLPVITTDRGGNAEIVQTGVQGIVLEEWHDPLVLAANVVSVLENRKRAQAMGLAGRRLVEKFFTWSRVATDLEKVLQEAARSTRKRVVPAIKVNDGIIQKRGQPIVKLVENNMLSDTLQKLRFRTYHRMALVGSAPRAALAKAQGAAAKSRVGVSGVAATTEQKVARSPAKQAKGASVPVPEKKSLKQEAESRARKPEKTRTKKQSKKQSNKSPKKAPSKKRK